MRNLRMFRRLSEQQKAQTPTEKRARLLKQLVATEEWQAFLEEVDLFMMPYVCPIPRTVPELIGYSTFSIVRDGVAQLLAQVEARAAQATEGTMYDGEPAIDVKPL